MMSKRFVETEYNALTKNVRIFKRTQKLYNTILDSGCNERIAEAANIANEIKDFIDEIKANGVPSSELKVMEGELHRKYFMIIRIIVLQITVEKPESEYESGFDFKSLADFTASKAFYHWITKYEVRKAVLAGYCLLLCAKRDNPSVQQAFQEVNGYLREFSESGKHSLKTYFKNGELEEAVYKLLKVCIDNADDEKSCQETLFEYRFKTIYNCLYKDIVLGTTQHITAMNFFNMCRLFN